MRELALGLIAAAKILQNDGILIAASFHSLEDKIIKNFFSLYSNASKNPSRYLPLEKNKLDLFQTFLKKPLTPHKDEILQNVRSRSAKLRYAIRNKNLFFYPEEFKKNFESYFKLEEVRL